MSLGPSKKCFSESLKRVASESEDSIRRVVLESLSRLVMKDDNYYEHTIAKIIKDTALPREAVVGVFKNLRRDKGLIEGIQIDGFAESLE